MTRPNLVLNDLDSAIKAISIIAGVTDITDSQWSQAVALHDATKNVDVAHITDKYTEYMHNWMEKNTND